MAASLDGLVHEMEKHSVDELWISCHAEAMRGMRGLEAFTFSGARSLRQTLEDRGAFEAKGNREAKSGPPAAKSKAKAG